MKIEVIRARAGTHESRMLELEAGRCVADAIRASGIDLSGICGYAVFGERVTDGHPLKDGDRLELLSPLLIDPKDARRRRAGTGMKA